MADLVKKIDALEVEKALEIGRLASSQFLIIMEAIKAFEEGLNPDEEVAVKLTSFGQSVTMVVTAIGYHDPKIIDFYGLVNGRHAHLIQNISQLNFLILASPISNPERVGQKIGFLA